MHRPEEPGPTLEPRRTAGSGARTHRAHGGASAQSAVPAGYGLCEGSAWSWLRLPDDARMARMLCRYRTQRGGKRAVPIVCVRPGDLNRRADANTLHTVQQWLCRAKDMGIGEGGPLADLGLHLWFVLSRRAVSQPIRVPDGDRFSSARQADVGWVEWPSRRSRRSRQHPRCSRASEEKSSRKQRRARLRRGCALRLLPACRWT